MSAIYSCPIAAHTAKRVDAEPQVLGRESDEAISDERRTLERDLNQRRIALLLQVIRAAADVGRDVGVGRPANPAKHLENTVVSHPTSRA